MSEDMFEAEKRCRKAFVRKAEHLAEMTQSRNIPMDNSLEHQYLCND